MKKEFQYPIPPNIYHQLQLDGILAGSYLYRLYIRTINALYGSTFDIPSKQYCPAVKDIDSFEAFLINLLIRQRDQSKGQLTLSTFKKRLLKQFVKIFPDAIYDQLFAKSRIKPMSWLSKFFYNFIQQTDNEDSKTVTHDSNQIYSAQDQTNADSSSSFRHQPHDQSDFHNRPNTESSNSFRHRFHYQPDYQNSNYHHQYYEPQQPYYFVPLHIGRQLYHQMFQSFNYWVSRRFNVLYQYLQQFHNMQLAYYPNQFSGFF